MTSMRRVAGFSMIAIGMAVAAPARAQSPLAQAKARWQAEIQVRMQQAAEKGSLAEGILDRKESASGKFDAIYRAYLKQELLKQPLSALRAGDLAMAAVVPSSQNLVYIPVTPCRIFDTRVAGGVIGAGTTRDLLVTGADLSAQGGSAIGCGIPKGPATAAAINFVAVGPAAAGDIRVTPFGTPMPLASIINYAKVTGLNIANGVVVTLCDPAVSTCTSDFTVQADVGATHLVGDVQGYFQRANVIDQATNNGNTVTLPPGGDDTTPGECTNFFLTGTTPWGVTITVPVAGRITVTATAQFLIQHTNGQVDMDADAHIGTSPTNCPGQWGFDSYAYTDSNLPTTANGYQPVVPLQKVFDVTPGTYTYYLNGDRLGGGSDVAQWLYASMKASFQPN